MSRSEVFQAFWHGCPLPLLQWACLKSFITRGQRVQLYVYDEIEVPEGIELVRADTVLPRSEIFHFRNPSSGELDLGPFSDLFRFKLLWQKGGWYVDTDVICNTDDFPACEFAWARELPELSPNAIGTSQIRFPAGDATVKLLWSECDKLKEAFTIREELGPRLLSRVLAELSTPVSHLGTTALFYPLRWIEAYKLWLPGCESEVVAKSRRSLFINCYNSLFSYMELTKTGIPPRGSFLMRFYEAECPERISGPVLAEEDVLAPVRRWFEERQWAIDELRAVAGEDALQTIGIQKA